MSQDEPTPEDIAGLFRKFGGDAHGYKEFAPPETEAEAPKVWPLLTGEKIVRPVEAARVQPPAPAAVPVAPAPVAAVPPAPRIEPVLRPPAPVAAPVPAPQPPALAPLFAQPAAAPVAAGSAATPLAQLFARLAAPQPPAAPPGPMSRWRRPT
jgi:hypothetical protein